MIHYQQSPLGGMFASAGGLIYRAVSVRSVVSTVRRRASSEALPAVHGWLGWPGTASPHRIHLPIRGSVQCTRDELVASRCRARRGSAQGGTRPPPTRAELLGHNAASYAALKLLASEPSTGLRARRYVQVFSESKSLERHQQ